MRRPSNCLPAEDGAATYDTEGEQVLALPPEDKGNKGALWEAEARAASQR